MKYDNLTIGSSFKYMFLYLGLSIAIGFIFGILNIFEINFIVTYTDVLSFIVVYFFLFKSCSRKIDLSIKSLILKKINAKSIIYFLFAMVGLIILLNQVDRLLIILIPMPQFFIEIFDSIIFQKNIVLSIITVVLIPGICEELFCRGYLLFGKSNKEYSVVKRIIFTSLIFGIMHLNPWQLAVAIPLGILFSWVAINTKSLILAILGHILNNSFALYMAYNENSYITQLFNNGIEEGLILQNPILNISGIILLVTGVILLKMEFGKSKTEPSTQLAA